MADRATLQMLEGFPPRAVISLSNGGRSSAGFSQERLLDLLTAGVSRGIIKFSDALGIIVSIVRSGLPLLLTDDDRAMIHLEQDLMRLASLAIVMVDLRGIALMSGRTRPWFEVSMPNICMAGCHPVYLFCDGLRVGLGRVRNAEDARNLVNGWAKTFGLPDHVKRSLRTTVVRTTARYNAALSEQHRTQ